MAVKKATTTADLTAPAEPTSEATASEVAVDQKASVKLKSPAGFVSEVPAGIVEALLDSGYTKTK